MNSRRSAAALGMALVGGAIVGGVLGVVLGVGVSLLVTPGEEFEGNNAAAVLIGAGAGAAAGGLLGYALTRVDRAEAIRRIERERRQAADPAPDRPGSGSGGAQRFRVRSSVRRAG